MAVAGGIHTVDGVAAAQAAPVGRERVVERRAQVVDHIAEAHHEARARCRPERQQHRGHDPLGAHEVGQQRDRQPIAQQTGLGLIGHVVSGLLRRGRVAHDAHRK